MHSTLCTLLRLFGTSQFFTSLLLPSYLIFAGSCGLLRPLHVSSFPAYARPNQRLQLAAPFEQWKRRFVPWPASLYPEVLECRRGIAPQLRRIPLDGTGGPNLGLDTVELLWTVEETFGIKISDADAARMRTVGDLNQFIADQVAARASRPGHPVTPEPSLTWERLVPIVVEELGVRREQVSPDAEWARDLGAS